MKHHRLLYLVCALAHLHSLHAVLLITGDGTISPYIFTSNITAKVLNPISGTFFVGVNAPADPVYAIASATRPHFPSTQTFNGIAGQLPSPSSIEFLALTQIAGCPAILPFVIQNGTDFAAQQVSAIFETGTSFMQTPDLNDASGSVTSGIVQLASSNTYIFAAVRPAGANVFGSNNSGIALINLQCLQSTGTDTIVLTVKDATTGFNSNLAQVLDSNSGELGTTPVIINPTEPGNPNTNQVALYYDLPLDRLYIGMRIQTGMIAPQIGKAVVVGTTSPTGLTLLPIVANNAISPQSLITDEIIVTSQVDTIDLRALNLRVMHASTGSSYLIVHGGQGETQNVSNLIYALPLVDNPNNPLLHGTLANKNAPLSNFKFVTPAQNPGDLALGSDPAALVGTSPLPIDSATAISDMVVAGDTVYVSIDQAPSGANDTGIFYSQALFSGDNSTQQNAGKIVGWTPWTKRAAPLNAFSNVTLPGDVIPNGSVLFFDVDLKTGSMWVVDGTTARAVGYTTWTATGQPNDLMSTINTALSNGCYSALDLHQGVRGITSTPDRDRYALFGGTNKVLFTRVSQAYTSSIASPQVVTTDFSSTQNHLILSLPPAAGSVTTLQYSRRLQTEGATNYFFAGTSTGLYVFSAGGNGFNVNTLSTLDQPPFSIGSWTHVRTIPGAIVDIKTSGKSLYVVTFEPTATAPLKSKVYAIPFAPTVAAMFDSSNIITLAESGTNPALQNTLLFTGIQIVDTGDIATTIPPRLEQLILATNNGLFASHADQTGNTDISDATDQTDAAWQTIDTNDNTYFSGIAGIDSQTPHTTFPLQFAPTSCQLCERSSVLQLNGSGDGITDTGFETIVPTFFNAQIETPPFETLNPITSFFSDGARRFFINQPITRGLRRTMLSIIPFDTIGWSVSGQTELAHPVLTTVDRLFWVLPIGATGLTLAGTEFGVVGLN